MNEKLKQELVEKFTNQMRYWQVIRAVAREIEARHAQAPPPTVPQAASWMRRLMNRVTRKDTQHAK